MAETKHESAFNTDHLRAINRAHWTLYHAGEFETCARLEEIYAIACACLAATKDAEEEGLE